MEGEGSYVAPAGSVPQSPWHSPVPYLFGGLAAMLGLIAFALLILACSYWKLSGYLQDGRRHSEAEDIEEAAAGDIRGGGGGGREQKTKEAGEIFEEKILVIMAGEVKPTFLATPVSSRLLPLHSKEERSIITRSMGMKEGHHNSLHQHEQSSSSRSPN